MTASYDAPHVHRIKVTNRAERKNIIATWNSAADNHKEAWEANDELKNQTKHMIVQLAWKMLVMNGDNASTL